MGNELVPHEGRKRPLVAIDFGPDANATFNDMQDHMFIRRYVSSDAHGSKAQILPDAIELKIFQLDNGEGYRVVVFENPDTDQMGA